MHNTINTNARTHVINRPTSMTYTTSMAQSKCVVIQQKVNSSKAYTIHIVIATRKFISAHNQTAFIPKLNKVFEIIK